MEAYLSAIRVFLESNAESLVKVCLPALFLLADAWIKARLGLRWERYGADIARCGVVTLFSCMAVSFVAAPEGVPGIRAVAAVWVFLLHYLSYAWVLKLSAAEAGWLAENKGWLQATGGSLVFYSAILFAVDYLVGVKA